LFLSFERQIRYAESCAPFMGAQCIAAIRFSSTLAQ
jgi:hypothetical protein